MRFPTNLLPLIDADILRYEVGFASEVAWRAKVEDPDALPPFDFVESMLHDRLQDICNACGTDATPILFLTEGKTFREDVAKTKPYKGTRASNKPWHFDNLSVYMKDILDAKITPGLEADDAMAIASADDPSTIICSRDKDLRQIPGWFYSWELGKQPSFGPHLVTKEGSLYFTNKGLIGTGLSWFYAQMLMGDVVDNIPGVHGIGPKKAFELLEGVTGQKRLAAVREAYKYDYPYMTEQGKLLWIVRRLNPDGSPVTYEIGMEE